MQTRTELVDYLNPDHAQHLVFLLDCYARDPMGGGQPLSALVKEQLAHKLSSLPHAFSVISYVDEQPAGLANCLESFSTFTCKPLVNIHDLVVASEYRGQGVGQLLLAKIEAIARAKGCAKLTLEVLEGNTGAKALYRKFGFSDYALDPEVGRAMFWEKTLGED